MVKNNMLLVVLAHPDDESFGMGGTLAKYSAEGFDVQLLCATKGEAGDVSPELLVGFESIGDLRESELRCAAMILGISQVHFMGYRDSGMAGSSDNQNLHALASQPVNEVSSKIALYIRKLRPGVVITFDPIGGYRHPDHIAVHNATVDAFHQAGDVNLITEGFEPFSPGKLYFHTFPKGFLRYAVKLLKLIGKDPRKFGKNGDIDLESFAYENFPVHAVINIKKYRMQKEKAGNCHVSQGGGRMGGGLVSILFRLFGTKEMFMQAYPEIDSRFSLSHDFFCD